MAVAGLPKQAKVAVGALVQIGGGHVLQAVQGDVYRLAAGDTPPGLDQVADKVDTARYGLQHGLAGVEM